MKEGMQSGATIDRKERTERAAAKRSKTRRRIWGAALALGLLLLVPTLIELVPDAAPTNPQSVTLDVEGMH